MENRKQQHHLNQWNVNGPSAGARFRRKKIFSKSFSRFFPKMFPKIFSSILQNVHIFSTKIPFSILKGKMGPKKFSRIWKNQQLAYVWKSKLHLGKILEKIFKNIFFFGIGLQFLYLGAHGSHSTECKYRGRKNGLQPKKDRGSSKAFFRALYTLGPYSNLLNA